MVEGAREASEWWRVDLGLDHSRSWMTSTRGFTLSSRGIKLMPTWLVGVLAGLEVTTICDADGFLRRVWKIRRRVEKRKLER